MNHPVKLPAKLINNGHTFEILVSLSHLNENKKNSEIIILFSDVVYIQPNILAVLCCILEKLRTGNNRIILKGISKKIKKILMEYQFIPSNVCTPKHFMFLRSFYFNEKNDFIEHVNQSVMNVNPSARKVLVTRISELFDNACKHSLTPDNKLYISGYCNISADWVYLSIGNFGKTFYDNMMITQSDETIKKDYEAILWGCLKDNNRSSNMGIGLYHLTTELKNMDGFMWIISGRGYFDLKKGLVKEFNHSFKGTFITLGVPIIT